jgi:hypothetical protein
MDWPDLVIRRFAYMLRKWTALEEQISKDIYLAEILSWNRYTGFVLLRKQTLRIIKFEQLPEKRPKPACAVDLGDTYRVGYVGSHTSTSR